MVASKSPSGRATRGRFHHAANRGLRLDGSRAGLILVSPALVVVLFLLIIPIGEAFYYSMTNWNGITAHWVGPKTYVTVFSDPTFWRVLENNALMLIAVPATMFCGVVLAALLHVRVRGWRIFRGAIIIPTAVSWVVLGVVGHQAFAQKGLINGGLSAIGLGALRLDWLASPLGAIAAVGITFVYSLVGINTLIFVTGMSTIDPAIYEAARLDGARWGRTFFQLTLPLLQRYLLFAFVVTAISAFSAVFSLIYTMTGGGPNFGTTTIEFFIYQKAFGTGSFGEGALLGIVLFAILFGLTLVQFRLTRGET